MIIKCAQCGNEWRSFVTSSAQSFVVAQNCRETCPDCSHSYEHILTQGNVSLSDFFREVPPLLIGTSSVPLKYPEIFGASIPLDSDWSFLSDFCTRMHSHCEIIRYTDSFEERYKPDQAKFLLLNAWGILEKFCQDLFPVAFGEELKKWKVGNDRNAPLERKLDSALRRRPINGRRLSSECIKDLSVLRSYRNAQHANWIVDRKFAREQKELSQVVRKEGDPVNVKLDEAKRATILVDRVVVGLIFGDV